MGCQATAARHLKGENELINATQNREENMEYNNWESMRGNEGTSKTELSTCQWITITGCVSQDRASNKSFSD